MYYLYYSKLILKLYFFFKLPVGDFVLPAPKICRDGESLRWPMRGNGDNQT